MVSTGCRRARAVLRSGVVVLVYPGHGLAPDDVDAAYELVTEHMRRRLSTLSQR